MRGIAPEPWQQVIADVVRDPGWPPGGHRGHPRQVDRRRAGWSTCSSAAGADPAAFVGALLPSSITGGPPATARWGSGAAFVVEADEYAGNFDAYRPDVAVLLNAEWDHPDVFADEAAVLDAFAGWLRAPGAAGADARRERGRPGRARGCWTDSMDWPGSVVRVGPRRRPAGAPGSPDVTGRLAGDGVLTLEVLTRRPSGPGWG